MVVSGRSTTARSWPDPSLNNRWPGVVPRYFSHNPNSATTFGIVVPACGNPAGAKPLAGTAKTLSAPKMGSAKCGLARGYRLTFAMTGLGVDDLSRWCDATNFSRGYKHLVDAQVQGCIIRLVI